MATATKTFDLSTISNEKGSATYGFTYSGGVLTPANKGNHNTYAYAKLTFEMPGDGSLTLGVTQSSEKNYDFGLVSNLDTSLAYSTSVDSSVKYNAQGLDGSTTITYDNVTKGSHFITVKYKKDGSANNGSDAFNITSLVATYEAAVEGVTTFDLSTLELAEGTYDITVVAKADGYIDSAESEAVSYEVAAAEDELAGTWLLIDDPNYVGLSSWYVNFISNRNIFTWLGSGSNPDALDGLALIYENSAEVYYVYDFEYTGSWSDEAFRTIQINSKLSEVSNGDKLLAWLKTNATKQCSKPLISFTINEVGTSVEYQAEEGMTWTEWCASDYDISPIDATESYVISNNRVHKHDNFTVLNWYVQDSYNIAVNPSDVIQPNGKYVANAGSDGGSND